MNDHELFDQVHFEVADFATAVRLTRRLGHDLHRARREVRVEERESAVALAVGDGDVLAPVPRVLAAHLHALDAAVLGSGRALLEDGPHHPARDHPRDGRTRE